MAIDVARARAETPGCGKGLHFGAAGASLMPAVVLDAQLDHLRLEAEVGGYKAARLAAEAIEGTYDSLARLLGCGRQEIAVIENATLAWNLALHAVDFAPGDRILTAEAEYASNYISYLRLAEHKGVEVLAVPSTPEGELDVAALESLIDERVKLISVTHVPTNGGLVNPAAEIGRVARAAGVPYLLDACQSVGQLDLDVEAIGCDILTASARKFLRGPRGIGFLYVRDEVLERLDPPFLDLHGARWETAESYSVIPGARRFETWEFNYASVLGMAAAVDYALDWGLPAIEARVCRARRDAAQASCRHSRHHGPGHRPAQVRHRLLFRRGPRLVRSRGRTRPAGNRGRHLHALQHPFGCGAARPADSGAGRGSLLHLGERDRGLCPGGRGAGRMRRERLAAAIKGW